MNDNAEEQFLSVETLFTEKDGRQDNHLDRLDRPDTRQMYNLRKLAELWRVLEILRRADSPVVGPKI